MTTGTYINIYGTLSGVAEYTGNIAIPLDSTTDTWEAGVSYEYVILFGKGGTTGGGGYNPDQAASGTDNEKPEKILLPITLFVTVAEWSNVSQEDIIL